MTTNETQAPKDVVDETSGPTPQNTETSPDTGTEAPDTTTATDSNVEAEVTDEKKKGGIIKTLAIVGLIALIVFGVWGTVQIVRVIPSAFSSLASVADSVESGTPVNTLVVKSEKSIVNSGESFEIEWTDLNKDGEYGFYYSCVDGTSVEIRDNTGKTSPITCGSSPTALPDGDTSLTMAIESEKNRFVDVVYTISFTEEDDKDALFERNSKVTVVNATIPQSFEVENDENSNTSDEDGSSDNTDDDSDTDNTDSENDNDTEDKDTADEDSSDEGDDTSDSVSEGDDISSPAPTEYTYIPTVPVSDPNGFVDLSITFLSVGSIDDGVYTIEEELDNDDRGAIRFAIKNIGTKTSDEWDFDAELPNGQSFKSDDQRGLKPRETAIFTVGFDFNDETGDEDFSVEIDVPNDISSANDSFDEEVEVTS